ncbi:hypothetical protein [Streptomyces sp. N35]|uniref:hypothetical protein n=1 Tax=Streptomyces sp. N35 TaxID=2795730 RepID=UPI0018F736BC|nr:hypothetical protein [Streptomyces sp. N35]
MPHVRDKDRRSACRKLLGLTHQDLTAVLDQTGRINLDTPHEGQQAFQAMLHTCLFSRHREHPIDRMEGRSFPELLLYFDGLLPRRDRLVLRLSCAARIARFLLPTQRTDVDGQVELTGLPGLRLESISTRSLVLRHVPTGSCLELLDRDRQLGAWDLHLLDKPFDRELLKNAPLLTPVEMGLTHYWAATSCTPLRSALLTRSYLWWDCWNHEGITTPAHRPDARYCVRWAKGRTTDEIGKLLTDSAVAIPGATYTPPSSRSDRGVLRLGAGLVELDGPRTPSTNE